LTNLPRYHHEFGGPLYLEHSTCTSYEMHEKRMPGLVTQDMKDSNAGFIWV